MAKQCSHSLIEIRTIRSVRGEKLHSNNYDKVETAIRERYEKSQSQTKTARPVKKDTVKR